MTLCILQDYAEAASACTVGTPTIFSDLYTEPWAANIELRFKQVFFDDNTQLGELGLQKVATRLDSNRNQSSGAPPDLPTTG